MIITDEEEDLQLIPQWGNSHDLRLGAQSSYYVLLTVKICVVWDTECKDGRLEVSWLQGCCCRKSVRLTLSSTLRCKMLAEDDMIRWCDDNVCHEILLSLWLACSRINFAWLWLCARFMTLMLFKMHMWASTSTTPLYFPPSMIDWMPFHIVWNGLLAEICIKSA